MKLYNLTSCKYSMCKIQILKIYQNTHLPHQRAFMICNNHNGNESCCYDGEQDTNDHCYWHYWHYTQQHTKKKE